MATRNLKDNSKNLWIYECYPQGREGKRIRKRLSAKGEAIAYECFTMREIDDKPLLSNLGIPKRNHPLLHFSYTLETLETTYNKPIKETNLN